MKRIINILKYWKLGFCQLAAMVLLLTFSAHSCENEKPESTLPPETQTGANTFGCYVNGELLVATRGFAPWGTPHLRAIYHSSNKLLTISGWGKNGTILMYISNPEENVKKELMRASFRYLDDSGIFYDDNIGEIFITRFDTINLIVSGTFAFELLPSDSSKIQITQGRFDVKIKESNLK